MIKNDYLQPINNKLHDDHSAESTIDYSSSYIFFQNTIFDFYDYLISCALAFFVIVYFFFTSPDCRYWGLLPLWICGTLAGSDIVSWFRNRLEIFDPKALAAAFLYLTTFIAPLLHLSADLYGFDLYLLNWPGAFARMAVLNCLGLGVYKWAQRKTYTHTAPLKSYWCIDSGRFILWAVPTLSVSLAAALVIRFFFGGLIKVGGESQISIEAVGYTAYLSVLRMLGDPFVLLLITFWIVLLSQKKSVSGHRTGWITIGSILFLVSILQFLMVGLRGSRSVILATVLPVAIMIHFALRQYTRKWVIFGMVIVVVFLYLYGFRKKVGLAGLEAFYNPQVRKSLSAELGGYSIVSTILGDLSRADLQALMLANLTEYKKEIQYKPVWGSTYTMAFLTFVPRAIWKNKPMGLKKDAGTDIQGLLRGDDKSTRQYGLAGEAMLNFGYWGILPAFGMYGIGMGYFRKKLSTFSASDSRIFFVPLIILMLQNMVIQDSDNWMFALLRDGFLLYILIRFTSAKSRLQNAFM